MLELIIALYVVAFVMAASAALTDNQRNLIATPITLVMLIQVLAVWPGLFFGLVDGWVVHSITPVIFLIATAALALGISVARKASDCPADIVVHYRAKKPEPTNVRGLLIAGAIACVVMILDTLFVHKGIPQTLIGILTAPGKELVAEAVQSRFDSTKAAYFGGEYRGQGFFRTINLLFSYGLCTICIYLGARYRFRYWLPITIFAGVVGLVSLSSATRTDIAFVGLSTMIAASLMFRIRARHVAISATIMIAALLSITAMQGRFDKLKDLSGVAFTQGALGVIAFRVLAGNSIHTVQTLELTQSGVMTTSFGHYHSVAILNSIPGAKTGAHTLPFILNRYINPRAVATTTFNSPTYLAVCFADFGMIGVAIIYFIFGYAMLMLEHAFYRGEKSIENLAVLVMLTMAVVGFDLGAGPIAVITNGGMAVFPFLGLRYLLRNGKKPPDGVTEYLPA